MKVQWMWVGSLLLALMVVAGCKGKKSESSVAKKSADHPCGTKSADHPCGKTSAEHPGKGASPKESDKKSVAATEQATCPVMDSEIKKSIHVDHMGKRVYLCCEMCIGTFNKEPMKYIKKLEDTGVVLAKTPA